ncbi:MAG TPA: cyclophilin-like fold protein [Nitrospinota bacterium]|nr:cyclophilin-like fold protein [Nitrospinota bacterium]
MVKKIKLNIGGNEFQGELNETKTAEAVWEKLPIKASGNRWGDEIYFSIPVKMGSENPKEVVEKGDLAYWPPGNAFCIFWGPTPASVGDECRPASPVNVFGRILGDLSALNDIKSTEVTIEKEE